MRICLSGLLAVLLCLSCAGRGASPDPPVRMRVHAGEASATGMGMPCRRERCAPGLTCVRYFGVAGPAGEEFASCELPCPEGKCPAGLSCATFADGPGRVCR